MKNETHLIFEKDKILISPDLGKLFKFLENIENEVSNIILANRNMADIREQTLELLKIVEIMSNHLKENNINYTFQSKLNIEDFPKYSSPRMTTRSEMIVLFSQLEVLMCIQTAYELETSTESLIICNVMDKKRVKNFINKYLLNDNNKYFKENLRTRGFSARKFRNLRNKLVHFFGVVDIQLSPHEFNDQTRKMEKLSKGKVAFLSPVEFYELLKDGARLLLSEFSDEFLNDKIIFNKKIKYVIEVVDRDAPILVGIKDLNI